MERILAHLLVLATMTCDCQRAAYLATLPAEEVELIAELAELVTDDEYELAA